MPGISQRIEDAITARLAHETYGFNAQIAALAGDYDLDPSDFQLNFGSDSENYFIGTDPDDAADEDMTYPLAVLEVLRSDNQNLSKGPFGHFSGEVRARLRIAITNPYENLPRISTGPGNLVEEAMYICFCHRQPGKIWTPGNAIVWAADLACERGAWGKGGENWIMSLNFTFTFTVDTR